MKIILTLFIMIAQLWAADEETALVISTHGWKTHMDGVLGTPETISKTGMAFAIPTTLLSTPVFGMLSRTCGGFINTVPTAYVCGIGNLISTGSIFFLTTYNIKDTFPLDATPSTYYQRNKVIPYLKDAGFFTIGWFACVPIYALNQIMFKGMVPKDLLTAWSILAQIGGGISYVWPMDELKNWFSSPLQSCRLRFTNSREAVRYRFEIITALSKYQSYIQSAPDEAVLQIQEDEGTALIRRAFEQQQNSHGQSQSWGDIGVRSTAAFIGGVSGYANWPLAASSVQGWLPHSGWTTALAECVGATGFLTLAALNAITCYDVFGDLLQSMYRLPQTARDFPAAFRHYLGGSFREIITPLIMGTFKIITFYLSITAALSQMNITTMETSGGFQIFLLTCTAIGTTVTAYYCLDAIVSGIGKTILKTPPVLSEVRRGDVLRKLSLLKKHVALLRDDYVTALYQEDFARELQTIN